MCQLFKFILSEYNNEKYTVYKYSQKLSILQNTQQKNTEENKMKCCICGTVKNCGKYLDSIFSNIEKIGTLFQEYVILMYYDESEDDTLDKLEEYKKKNRRLFFHVNKERFPFRTYNIAKGRNFCIQEIRQKYRDYDYFIVMDCDNVCSDSVKIEVLQKYLKRKDWDSISFNKEHYYDIWALSILPYVLSFRHFMLNDQKTDELCGKIRDFTQKMMLKLEMNQLLQCWSAFNGFAIYRVKKFIDCFYDGSYSSLKFITPKTVEINTTACNSLVALKNKTPERTIKEDCEHRHFHLHAISMNNAKVYISPEILFYNDSNEVYQYILKKEITWKTILKPLWVIDLAEKTNIIHDSRENEWTTFYPCNTGITKYNDDYILNIRYVNYYLDYENETKYSYRSKYKENSNVYITTNKYVKLNPEFGEIESKMMTVDFEAVDKLIDIRENKKAIVVGVEDVRLYKFKNDVKYIGSMEFNECVIGVVSGNYNFNDLNNYDEIHSNLNCTNWDKAAWYNKCEKNWVFFEMDDKLFVVYKWFPLQICSLDYELKWIHLEREVEMPPFFEKMRGSTCGCTFENEIWFLTHFHTHEHGGKYYNVFVIFDLKMNLRKYSQPFRFEGKIIEFCIGLIVEKERFLMTYSINDGSSKLGVYDKRETVDSLAWVYL